MNRLALLLLFSFFLIAGFGCRKDTITTDDEVIQIPSPETLAAVEVYGRVTDLDGQPLEGATVGLETATTLTDENGFYQLEAVTDAQHAVLSVEKDGYFSTYPAFNPPKEGRQLLNAQLYERQLVATFSGLAGGEWESPEGIRVVFPYGPGAYERISDGYDYNQTIEVYAHYLDPTDPQLADRMPGNLLALNTSGEQQGLQTFGMINVELQTPAGERLQLKNPAYMEMPVPPSLQGNAPAEIPLWYFDENSGLWIEEGSATLEGSKYQGEVRHFTFWNCDVPTDFIWLSGEVSPNGQYLPLTVRVTWIEQNSTMETTTSDRGHFSGWVPNEAELLLEILSPCGEVIYSEIIGPFNQNTQLPPIEVDLGTGWSNFSGSIIDCDGDPVDNGYALLTLGNNSHLMLCDAGGDFFGYFPTCGETEGEVIGYDIDNSMLSAATSFMVEETVNLGVLEACDQQLTAQLVIEYDGNTVVISDVTVIVDSLTGAGTHYDFVCAHVFNADDKVIYDITIADWGGFYAISSTHTIVGNPPEAYFISAGSPDIIPVHLGALPGDYVQFEISNASITENISGTNYPEGAVSITAIIVD